MVRREPKPVFVQRKEEMRFSFVELLALVVLRGAQIIFDIQDADD